MEIYRNVKKFVKICGNLWKSLKSMEICGNLWKSIQRPLAPWVNVHSCSKICGFKEDLQKGFTSFSRVAEIQPLGSWGCIQAQSYGNLWESKEICGIRRKSMEVNGKLWKSFEIYGNL